MSFVKIEINFRWDKKLSYDCKYNVGCKSLHIFHVSDKHLFSNEIALPERSMHKIL